jgi:hypothetical protein
MIEFRLPTLIEFVNVKSTYSTRNAITVSVKFLSIKAAQNLKQNKFNKKLEASLNGMQRNVYLLAYPIVVYIITFRS